MTPRRNPATMGVEVDTMQIGDRDDRHAATRPRYIDLAPLEWPARRLTAEVKEDGQWVEVVISGRTAQVWSRHGILIEVIPIAEPVLGTSVLCGELLKGTARSKGARAGQVVLFDCVEYFGDDVRGLPQHSRRSRTADIVGLLSPRFELVQSFASWSMAWDYVLDNDLEGLVLKDPMVPWGVPWWRMKQVFEIDAEVLAVDGNALVTTAGRIPVYGDVRSAMMLYPEAHIGRVCKVRGNAITAKGKLRHPRFGEWHAEKGTDINDPRR